MTNNPTLTTKTQNKSKYILSAVLFIMLMVGLIATYWLTQQSQDIRQQASEPVYIECSGGYTNGETACATTTRCVVCNGTTGLLETTDRSFCEGQVCEPRDLPTDCDGDYHELYGNCVSKACKDQGGGIVVCGYATGEDVCTTDSLGGDHCTDANGVSVPCAELGMIRCQCSPGSDNGWWVIGMADSCNDLCGEANIDCTDCPPSSPRPSTPPPSSPSPTPNVSPSPTPSPGPQCLNITMNNPAAELGDQTTFTCGEVTGAVSYVFRVMDPNGIISNLNATGQISAPYLINQSGTYFAQCQICTGSTQASCHDWETLPTP